jgi:O-succinylhomoserine sulfhydrylase
MDGQGRVLAGAVCGTSEFIDKTLLAFTRNTGPTLSAFNAWVLLKGLETLELRVKAHCDNATAVARHLEARGDISRVLFPGLSSHPQYALAQKQMSGPGNVVGFDVPGGKEGAFRFMNALELIDISNNLGDAKSLVTHPTTTTHQRLTEEDRLALGITPGYVRLSVGLEDAADIVDDLDRAVAAAKRG